MVYLLFSVSKYARPTSTVLPFARSSLPESSAHDRYHVSLPAALASCSYFSIVRLSTAPVKNSSWPPMVDLPASTWPVKMMLRCPLMLGSLTSSPYRSRMASAPAAVCSLKMASASFFALTLVKLVAEVAAGAAEDVGVEVPDAPLTTFAWASVAGGGGAESTEGASSGALAGGAGFGSTGAGVGAGEGAGEALAAGVGAGESFFSSDFLPMLSETGLAPPPPMLSDGAALGAPPPILREGAGLAPPMLSETGLPLDVAAFGASLEPAGAGLDEDGKEGAWKPCTDRAWGGV